MATTESSNWQIGSFVRPKNTNPVLRPNLNARFLDPATETKVLWENANVFNPAACSYHNKIILLYRAEADPTKGVGGHTSRIGFAQSSDGLHFKARLTPVLFPAPGANYVNEKKGGCEDPRIVSDPNGGFILTYTAYDHKTARLCVARSQDLIHWTKFGPAFKGPKFANFWSKSGSIVTKVHGSALIAIKIKGKYWMYWGDEPIHFATSSDLIHWHPGYDKSGKLITVLDKRAHHFDSDLVEPGPPAILTKSGIVLLYNGMNAKKIGDPQINPGAYSAGEVLFSTQQPTKILDRSSRPFLTPAEPYEKTGQYKAGTVFIEGLVPAHQKWYLYFGTADSFVGVAICKKPPK